MGKQRQGKKGQEEMEEEKEKGTAGERLSG